MNAEVGCKCKMRRLAGSRRSKAMVISVLEVKGDLMNCCRVCWTLLHSRDAEADRRLGGLALKRSILALASLPARQYPKDPPQSK